MKLRYKAACENIADYVSENYNGRNITIWGVSEFSESVKETLLDRMPEILIKFVDSNKKLHNYWEVFSPDILEGKSEENYVVVTISLYKEVKDQLAGYGYLSGKDYYYFNDCVLNDNDFLFEDTRGNKVIGWRNGLHISFIGFNSTIVIDEKASFINTFVYLYNNSDIKIGKSCRINDSSIVIDNAQICIKDSCLIQNTSIRIDEQSECFLENQACINGCKFSMKHNSKTYVGSCFSANKSDFTNYGILLFGNNCTVWESLKLYVDNQTKTEIGNDCMFSYGISLFTNDLHSIFDVNSGCNINSTEYLCKQRYVKIGDHVWVGMRSTILYNTVIGNGSIIGANSLCKKPFPNNCIIAGNPAKIIKKDIAWSRKNNSNNIEDCGEVYIKETSN